MLAGLIRRRWPIPVLAVLIVFVVAGVALASSAGGDDTLVVYNGRSHYGDETVFDEFTEATGIELTLRGGTGPELFERLEREGADTPADVLVTTDLANLWRAENEGLLAPTTSPELEANVPEEVRDPGGQWWPLTVRLRVPVVSTERVGEGEVASYEDLGDPKWKGRTCLRTSSSEYNQSLVADFLAERGPEATRALLQSWMDNDPRSTTATVSSSPGWRTVTATSASPTTTTCRVRSTRTPTSRSRRRGPTRTARAPTPTCRAAGVVRSSDKKAQARQLLEFLTTRRRAGGDRQGRRVPGQPRGLAQGQRRLVGDGEHRSDRGRPGRAADPRRHRAHARPGLALTRVSRSRQPTVGLGGHRGRHRARADRTAARAPGQLHRRERDVRPDLAHAPPRRAEEQRVPRARGGRRAPSPSVAVSRSSCRSTTSPGAGSSTGRWCCRWRCPATCSCSSCSASSAARRRSSRASSATGSGSRASAARSARSCILTAVLYPYVYVLGRSAFLGQSRRAIEAARSLGLTYGQAVRRVAFPLARPALAGGVALGGDGGTRRLRHRRPPRRPGAHERDLPGVERRVRRGRRAPAGVGAAHLHLRAARGRAPAARARPLRPAAR